MKLIVELSINAAKYEKLTLRNHKMLATDFHIMDRKISMGYLKRKSQRKSSGVQHAIHFSKFCKDISFSLMI